MNISCLNEKDIHMFAPKYMEYFNADGDHWTYERAYRRLHQMWSIEDSICLKAVIDNKICGILLGYLNWFDESPHFHVFEILVLKEYQNCGIGTVLLQKGEQIAKSHGAQIATLETLNDEQHEHYYGKMGYKTKENLLFKRKDL